MKIKTFLSVNLLLSLFAVVGLNAQTTKEYRYTTMSILVYCDGIPDLLVGQVVMQKMLHFNPDGTFQWAKSKLNGDDLVSTNNGEVFKISSNTQDKKVEFWDLLSQNLKSLEGDLHYNFIGDKGTHYILHQTYRIDWPEDGSPAIFTMLTDTHKCF